MTTSLLTTKFYIPPCRPRFVSRPLLIEQLNAGLDRKLTLISAPAGFGKTTLLSEWSESCSRPIAWVSLDERDNDPTHFWSYFIAALQKIHPEIGEAALAVFRSPQSPTIDAILTEMINEIAAVSTPFALVLDDYHLIENSDIHNGLVFLLNHLPMQMHLVVSGRADPPWPLARLRGQSEMNELRTRDLRFNVKEATTFLNHAMALDLSAEEVAALESRTEGWVAGLQMAAISMQRRMQVQGAGDLAGFIQAFTGSHRFVLDYLSEEVLDQQPTYIQEFLLSTSILDRLTASLCNAVTGKADSQTILNQLEKANLFLIPLDDERHWFRYHHLFADILCRRLESARPEQISALHHRASQWFEGNDLIAEAVNHATAAGDVERVARLVETKALAILDYSELKTLSRRFDALPGEHILSTPWLKVARAWIAAYTGQLDFAESLLRDAQKRVGISEEHTETVTILGHLAAINAYIAWVRGDGPRALKFARDAMAHLPEKDLVARCLALTTMGNALILVGDLAGAAQTSSEAVDMAQEVGYIHVSTFASSNLMYAFLLQGRLRDAFQLGRQMIGHPEHAEVVGQPLPAMAILYAMMSEVHRERNELKDALYYAQTGLELSQRWGQADGMVVCYVYLLKILTDMGEIEAAHKMLKNALPLASGISSWFEEIMRFQEVRLLLAQGEFTRVNQALLERDYHVDGEINHGTFDGYLVLARVLIAEDKSSRALELLARLLVRVEASGAMSRVIEILVLQAIAFYVRSDLEQALGALTRALALAKPEGYVRVFINEGEPMGELLRKAARRGIVVDYIGKLLYDIEKGQGDGEQTLGVLDSSIGVRSSLLIEPLSQRELEVLRLLNTSLSHQEIAEELWISKHTVRSHIKNIYGKLSVHSRMEAIEVARKHGLL